MTAPTARPAGGLRRMLLGSVADKPTATGSSVTHLSLTSMMGVGCHGLWACLLELAAESDPVARALAGTVPHRRERPTMKKAGKASRGARAITQLSDR